MQIHSIAMACTVNILYLLFDNLIYLYLLFHFALIGFSFEIMILSDTRFNLFTNSYLNILSFTIFPFY